MTSMTSGLSSVGQQTRSVTSGAGSLATAIVAIAAAIMATLGSFMSGWVNQASWLDPTSVVVAFYHGSGYQGRVGGNLLIGLAFLLVLVFIVRLADLIATADPRVAWLGRALVAVAAVDSALILASVAALTAPIWRAAQGGVSDEGFVIMNDVQFALGWLGVLCSAVLAITLGSTILRSRLLPRWLGWGMLADAVVFLVCVAGPVVLWDAAYGLLLLLLAVAGVLMRRGPLRPAMGGESAASS